MSSREMSVGMGIDIMDTGMDHHNAEDLRSYEAAVMARKAPTTLNLKVRRPMKGRVGGGGKFFRDEGSASASSGNSPRGDTTDCSSSSSLANAFGTGRLVGGGGSSHSRDQTVQQSLAPKSSAGTLPFAGSGRVKKEESESPSLSSRASSAEGDDNQSDLGNSSLEAPSPLIGGGSSNSSSSMGRPSFKRLPSQTLGPDNSKRPFYGFGEEVGDRVVSGWGVGGAIGNNNNDGGGGGGGGDEMVDRRDGGSAAAERKMRKRRMSEPWTSLTGVHGSGGGGTSGGGFDHRGEEKKLNRVDVSAVQNVDELWFSSF